MSTKILVVDDSLTIQKIIQMTLANKGYQLTLAENMDQLWSFLEHDSFEILLLDFNITKGLNGYQLTKKIIEGYPHIKTVLLFGTFDSVEDHLVNECGALGKLIKPFDAQDLLLICENLVLEKSNPLTDVIEERSLNVDSLEEVEDQWVVHSSVVPLEKEEHSSLNDMTLEDWSEVESTKKEGSLAKEKRSELHQEVEEWGMVVPKRLDCDDEDVEMVLPPLLPDEIIDRESTAPLIDIEENNLVSFDSQSNLTSEEEILYPSHDDLQYPEAMLLNVNDGLTFPEQSQQKRLTTELISVEDLQTSKGSEQEVSSDQESFEHTATILYNPESWKPTEEHAQQLQKEIEDEVVSHEHWESEAVKIKEEPVFQVEPKEDEKKLSQEEIENLLVDKLWQLVSPDLPHFMKQSVESYLDQHGAELIENFLWKIVPDLAERVINDQVRKISNEVKDQFLR